MPNQVLIWIQLAVSALLAVSILLQNRGAGLSASFGGDFGGYYTKRGMEKFLFGATIVFAVVFIALSIVNIYLGSRS